MVELWIKAPFLLIQKQYITQIWPKNNYSLEEQINALVRLLILITAALAIFTRKSNYLLVGLGSVLLVTLYGYYSINKKENFKKRSQSSKSKNENKNENMRDINKIKEKKLLPDSSNKIFSKPSNSNPMMNVMLPELNGNPNKLPAAPSFNNKIVNQINTKVKENSIHSVGNNKKLFEGLDAEMNFDHSMRNFYSTSSTTNPNDQKDFANFCYGNMVSGKTGNSDGLMSSIPGRIGAVYT